MATAPCDGWTVAFGHGQGSRRNVEVRMVRMPPDQTTPTAMYLATLPFPTLACPRRRPLTGLPIGDAFLNNPHIHELQRILDDGQTRLLRHPP